MHYQRLRSHYHSVNTRLLIRSNARPPARSDAISFANTFLHCLNVVFMSQQLISRVSNFRSATGTPSLRAQVAYITLSETRFPNARDH